ncbi:MAG TPA: hypothetical protein VKN82_07085 [Desulfohalobiaceae bacterium]|nr:hypothetical protein [Desulfohalobiaceae bacterium]
MLRDKPKIKWTKDRGKDVPSASWYHLGPEYGGNKGDRINEYHLSLAEKKFLSKIVESRYAKKTICEQLSLLRQFIPDHPRLSLDKI